VRQIFCVHRRGKKTLIEQRTKWVHFSPKSHFLRNEGGVSGQPQKNGCCTKKLIPERGASADLDVSSNMKGRKKFKRKGEALTSAAEKKAPARRPSAWGEKKAVT